MSSISSPQATCGYIDSIMPGIYGDQQEDYIKRTTEAAWDIVEQLKRSEKKDLQVLFFRCLENLGALRRQIAHDHNTSSAELFGIRREEVAIPWVFTILDNQYRKYNEKLIGILLQHFKEMGLSQEYQSVKTLEDKFLDRCTRFRIEIIEQSEIIKKNWCLPLGADPEFRSNQEASEEKTSAKTVIDRNILQNLREHRPALYERQKMFVCLLNLNCAFPEIPEKCHLYPGYILGTSELEINGKMSALTQYFTWLSWDETENVIDRMERCSKIMVFHHDIFQIEETLKDVAKLFEQAALWNPTTDAMRQLKDLVGLFRYELAHAMPFIRGSAAVGEILEASLYWFHGFSSFRHSKPGDLEALTSMLLTDFMETYHGMVNLESGGPSSSAI